MLGRDLVTTAAGRGHEVAGPDRAELDITDAVAVSRALLPWQPAVNVNRAAWTNEIVKTQPLCFILLAIRTSR
jgi:dTDP-4-dehydrorhamnose reductase